MSIETDVPSMGAKAYEPPTEHLLSGQINSNRSTTTSTPSPPDNSKAGLILGTLYRMWDVDAEDVMARCRLALNPLLSQPFLTNGLLDVEYASAPGNIAGNKTPDMWGPTWIYLTMVFAVFFAATTSGLLNKVQGSYNAGLLTGTAGTLFVFTFVVPVGAWFVIQYLDLVPTLTLLQTVCLYGYSCTSWIPAVILAGSPLGASAIVGSLAANLVRGMAILLAFLMSACFVYGNLYKVMKVQIIPGSSANSSKMAVVLTVGVLIHAGLAVTVLLLTSIASKELTTTS